MQFYEGQLYRKLRNYICNDVNGLPSRAMRIIVPVASFVVKRLKRHGKNLGPILGLSKNM